MIQIQETKDFKNWFNELNKKEQAQVAARFERLKSYGHFGDVKSLGKGLCELRWKNGWRVYFIVSVKNNIILIVGGHKNEQEKNIKKARIFISQYTTL